MQLPPLSRIPFGRHPADAPQRFDAWLEEPAGQAVIRAERRLLADWAPRLVGQRALEVGPGRNRNLLQDARLPGRWSLAFGGHAQAHLCGSLEALPIARNSLDALLLHHCLEFHDAPHQVLREAASCVAPGGMLAVIGFQPLSAMGLARWFTAGRPRPAWVGRYFRPCRLNDWLQVLGFEVEGQAAGFHTLPLSDRGRARLCWLDWLGRHLWWRHAGVYLLVARKRAAMVRPLMTTDRRFRRQRPTVITVPLARWRRPHNVK